LLQNFSIVAIENRADNLFGGELRHCDSSIPIVKTRISSRDFVRKSFISNENNCNAPNTKRECDFS
jgi:hypothetical protein